MTGNALDPHLNGSDAVYWWWLMAREMVTTFGVVTSRNDTLYRDGIKASLKHAGDAVGMCNWGPVAGLGLCRINHLTLDKVGGEGEGRNFAGDLAEVIIYSRKVSTTERIAVENYLMGKYLPASPVFPVAQSMPQLGFDFRGKVIVHLPAQTAYRAEVYRLDGSLAGRQSGEGIRIEFSGLPRSEVYVLKLSTSGAAPVQRTFVLR
jgi:hypothetical protein